MRNHKSQLLEHWKSYDELQNYEINERHVAFAGAAAVMDEWRFIVKIGYK